MSESELLNDYKKVSNEEIIYTKRLTSALICGGGLFVLSVYLGVHGYITTGDFTFILMFVIIANLAAFRIFIFGLFSTTSRLNLKTREIQITKRNWRGKSFTVTGTMGAVRMTATRIGISDANPTDIWIVKAEFLCENEFGETCGEVIWSKEVTDIKERSRIMIDLHRFFSNGELLDESNIITNGKGVFLLTEEEKKKFKEGALFKENDGDSKWDRLAES